jgi:hypothetical protein
MGIFKIIEKLKNIRFEGPAAVVACAIGFVVSMLLCLVGNALIQFLLR